LRSIFSPKVTGASQESTLKRYIVNAILSGLKGGITWRIMPNTFRCGKRFMIILAAGASVR